MSSLITNLPARCIGPLGGSNNNARVSDVAVFEKEPRIFYIGSCGGGLLKTEDGGKTTKVVFDKYGSSSIGAVAVSQKIQILFGLEQEKVGKETMLVLAMVFTKAQMVEKPGITRDYLIAKALAKSSYIQQMIILFLQPF